MFSIAGEFFFYIVIRFFRIPIIRLLSIFLLSVCILTGRSANLSRLFPAGRMGASRSPWLESSPGDIKPPEKLSPPQWIEFSGFSLHFICAIFYKNLGQYLRANNFQKRRSWFETGGETCFIDQELVLSIMNLLHLLETMFATFKDV